MRTLLTSRESFHFFHASRTWTDCFLRLPTWKAMAKPFADVPYLLGVDLGAHPVYEQLRSFGGLLRQEIQDGNDPTFERHRAAARRLAGFETDSKALVKAVWATTKSNAAARRRSLESRSAVEVHVPAM